MLNFGFVEVWNSNFRLSGFLACAMHLHSWNLNLISANFLNEIVPWIEKGWNSNCIPFVSLLSAAQLSPAPLLREAAGFLKDTWLHSDTNRQIPRQWDVLPPIETACSIRRWKFKVQIKRKERRTVSNIQFQLSADIRRWKIKFKPNR